MAALSPYFTRLSAPGMQARYDTMTRLMEASRDADEKRSGIPVIDLALYGHDPAAWSCVFVDSLSKNGFAIFKNHGLPVSDIAAAYDSMRDFFALPLDEKMKCRIDAGEQRGYGVYGRETHRILAGSEARRGDMKEYLMFGREDLPPDEMARHGVAPNAWPEHPGDFRVRMDALTDGMGRVKDIVLRALATGLGLPQDTFTRMERHADTIWRTNHYPAPENAPDTGGARSGMHTDGGLCTLLLSSGQKGLVAMPDIYDESTWLRPPADPKYMVFNGGKVLDRITRGFLPATWHMVEKPGEPGIAAKLWHVARHPVSFAREMAKTSLKDAWKKAASPGARLSVPLFIWIGNNEKIFEIDCPAPQNPSRSQRDVTERLLRQYPAGTPIGVFKGTALSIQRLAAAEKRGM